MKEKNFQVRKVTLSDPIDLNTIEVTEIIRVLKKEEMVVDESRMLSDENKIRWRMLLQDILFKFEKLL